MNAGFRWLEFLCLVAGTFVGSLFTAMTQMAIPWPQAGLYAAGVAFMAGAAYARNPRKETAE